MISFALQHNWPRGANQNTEKFPPPQVRPWALDEASYRLKRGLW